ncbi:DUF1917-domain-containing protein [Mycena venus]|uniref:DUF1917-domain-containing protein n=1 Tax=Mycena venus TaxID=2733690 RepID=A0A8H6YMK3_9AGAR|nr:DUF1917-domain-containing protein [Mycena venus]
MDPMDIDDDIPAASAAAPPCATRGPARLGNLLNPYLMRAESRQLDETVDEFLARLPPHPISANLDALPPWYWIVNPHVGLEYYRQQRDVDALERQGQDLLDRYRERKTPGNAFLPRHGSAELEKEIAELAKATGMVEGKWMLFPTIEEVNETWALVANATANNRLGTAAKIATAGKEEGDRCRLICVYTRDFTDKEDVERVLLELVRMGLVPAEKGGGKSKGKGIHYKCDAYTHLDVYAGNGYGLRPSIYSSAQMLPYHLKANTADSSITSKRVNRLGLS